MVGVTIGNFRITSRIGEGGMGVVYLAEHPGIGRKAAVKILHAALAKDPESVGRFFNEARAANAIHHPNIVQILDFGTLPDGASYIIMEYLEGEGLAARLQRLGRLAVADAIDLTMQAASGLAAAHDATIIHRDLKPDNVFLVPDARASALNLDQVKILDFGIAKLGGGMTDVSLKTRTGSLMGTPLYMSPEQCLGTKEVDARTDIYSLGLILYEMLCGQPPFVSDGIGALIDMHLNATPLPPRNLNPLVPEHLERVVLKALAKRPEDRHQTMRELREALGLSTARATVEGARTLAVPGPARATVASPEGGEARHPSTPGAGFSPGAGSSPGMARTTLSSSAGDTLTRDGPRAGARRFPLTGLAGLGAALVLLSLAWLGGEPAPPMPVPAPHALRASSGRGAAPRVPIRQPPPAAAEPPPAAADLVASSAGPVDARRRPRVWIHTDPPGVEVRIDGELVGRTPVENLDVAPRPSASIVLSGPGLASRTVNVPLDVDQRLSYSLSPARAAPRTPGAAIRRAPAPPRTAPAIKTER